MNDSNCPPFPELPPPSYGSNMVGAGKGNKKPPLPSVDSSMGSFSTRLGFTIDPLPMPDEARFTPGKVFQDVWASVLFLVHLMGVFALGVWLLQPASLSKFEWISNTFPNSGSVFNFYIEDLLILGLGWGFSQCFL
ncbi:hypothetical protein HMI54_013353 [Coelomomyces lativittatus]|nr:hypothetical protein HMI54_013353 [Coelomomyces lativittatus]